MGIVKYRSIAGVVMAAAVLGTALYLCPFSFKEKGDVQKGNAVMKQLAAQNVQEIDTMIQTIQDQFNIKNTDVSSFTARYANTIIMGDSLAAGLVEYRIMSDEIVMAERGRRTDNIDADVARVIQYAPKAVFMEYGINDLSYCRGDADRYAAQYKEQIIKIQQALPQTKIYVNSLTPISKTAIEGNPYYGEVDNFNKALQKMCKELHVTYIDNTHTLDFTKDVYEYDGVHPYYQYYPLWLSRMLKAAGL